MKLTKPSISYKVPTANFGFAPGYCTEVGSQIVNSTKKPPYLVTGGGNYLQGKVDSTVLQNYHVFLLFYPSNKPTWTTGVLLPDNICKEYIAFYSEDVNLPNSFKKCVD